MIKNVVITGGKSCGKTTLANELIEYINKDYSGYRIKRIITPVGGPIYALQDIKTSQSEIITTIEKHRVEGIKAVFDDYGTTVVRRAVNSSAPVVLFDEIGRFEKDSEVFVKAIESSFNSNKIIIAVLKKYDLPYISRIKSRDDITLVDLDFTPFEKAEKLLKNQLKRLFSS